MKAKLFFSGQLVLALLNVNNALFAQITETRNVSGFLAIEAGSAFNITVNKAATESLVIEADEAVMPYVRTEVKGGVLKLYLKDSPKNKNIKTLKATIGVKELNKIELSGACKLTSDDVFDARNFNIDLSGASAMKFSVKADRLEAELTGAANLNLTTEAQKVKFDASGAAKLNLYLQTVNAFFDMSGACKADIKGMVDEAKFDVSGACNVKADAMLCKIMSLEGSGAAKLEVNVSEHFDIHTSGACTVHYRGQPVIRINTSGASKVRSLE